MAGRKKATETAIELSENAQVIKLGPNDRLLIVAEGMPYKDSQRMADFLRNWWESGDKFAVIAVGQGIHIKIQKLEAGEE
jgi:pseudouridine-5'-phosphate glycosidase